MSNSSFYLEHTLVRYKELVESIMEIGTYPYMFKMAGLLRSSFKDRLGLDYAW
jgi:hypothetical protein